MARFSDIAEYTWRAGGSAARRPIAAWLAIFSLYLQLAVAGLCTCGLSAAADAGGLGPVPICHSAGEANPQSGNSNQAPRHFHECPFCMAHCHAAMVTTPALGAIDTHVAIVASNPPLPFVIPRAARFAVGTPPRGPPASI